MKKILVLLGIAAAAYGAFKLAKGGEDEFALPEDYAPAQG